jgi:hypothetical protein
MVGVGKGTPIRVLIQKCRNFGRKQIRSMF